MTIATKVLEDELSEARAALGVLEEAERASALAVDQAREEHAMGRLDRRALLRVQTARAAAMEATEAGKALVRALDKENARQREAGAAVEHSAKVERTPAAGPGRGPVRRRAPRAHHPGGPYGPAARARLLREALADDW